MSYAHEVVDGVALAPVWLWLGIELRYRIPVGTSTLPPQTEPVEAGYPASRISLNYRTHKGILIRVIGI